MRKLTVTKQATATTLPREINVCRRTESWSPHLVSSPVLTLYMTRDLTMEFVLIIEADHQYLADCATERHDVPSEARAMFQE